MLFLVALAGPIAGQSDWLLRACLHGWAVFSVHTSAYVVEFPFALCIDLIAISLAGVFFYIFIASGKCVICEKLKVLRVFSKVS